MLNSCVNPKHRRTRSPALVQVTEGRFSYVTRSAASGGPPTRHQAIEMGIPQPVGIHFADSGDRGSIEITDVTEQPGLGTRLLLGPTQQPSPSGDERRSSG